MYIFHMVPGLSLFSFLKQCNQLGAIPCSVAHRKGERLSSSIGAEQPIFP